MLDDYLNSLPRFATAGESALQIGLDRISSLLAAMGRPHETYPIVHVAGTNGKGSTASMLAAILDADGRRVGLHTSPHLVEVTERMRVGGVPAERAWLEEVLRAWRPLFEEVRPSFFEATVALSLRYFMEQEVDVAVVEVGLGGRWDATNVVDPVLAAITRIGLDHTDILGDSLAAIAAEKAGIIKEGVPVVMAQQEEEAAEVIRSAAREVGAELHEVASEVASESGSEGTRFVASAGAYGPLEVDLPGANQVENAATAVRAAELLGAGRPAVEEGLRTVRRRSGLRGRLDLWSEAPFVLADVAHNADALRGVLEFVAPRRGAGGVLHVVFGALADKDVGAMLDLLRGAGAHLWPVTLSGQRALPAGELVRMAKERDIKIEDPADAVTAFQTARKRCGPEEVLLITGSHHVVGGALAALQSERGGDQNG